MTPVEGGATPAGQLEPSAPPAEDGTFVLRHAPARRYRVVGETRSRLFKAAVSAASAEFDVGAGAVVEGVVVEVDAPK